jgi:hypothetical protein
MKRRHPQPPIIPNSRVSPHGSSPAPRVPLSAPRVPLASWHTIRASESGLVIVELFDGNGVLLARYERMPEAEAAEFIVDFEAAWQEAQSVHRRPAWERRG